MKKISFFAALMALIVLAGSSASGTDCPKASKITLMKVTMPNFEEAGPYDITKIKSAKVFLLDNGKRVKVCLASFELQSYLSVDAIGAAKPAKGDHTGSGLHGLLPKSSKS